MQDVLIPPASAATTGFVSSSHEHGHHGHHGEHRQGPTTSNFYESQAEAVVATSKVEIAVEKTGAAGQLATNVAGQQVQNLLLQQSNLAAVQAQTFFSANQLAIEKTAAASQLLAVQNAAAAVAVAAECCCEIKELVRADGEKTRDLVNSIQSINLAVQLSDAKAEILALRAGVRT